MPSPEDFARISGATAPAFSRDGRTLFHLCGAGQNQLWAAEIKTGTARQLTFHDEKVAFLRRSPIDDRLIYGIDRGGDERQQLLLIDPTQPRPRAEELTNDPSVLHDFGAWSPDGTRIAFAANSRDQAHLDVFVQDIASGERHCVHEGTHIVSVAGWRPDSEQLAIISDRGHADMSLQIVDLSAGLTRPVPLDPANWQSLRWAADGRALLGLTDHGSDNLRLCRLDPDTGALTVVYEAPGRDVEAWAISADATQLATIENDRGWTVLRVGPAGGEQPVIRITNGVAAEPTFSPDGSRLAFAASSPTEPSRLWVWEAGELSAISAKAGMHDAHANGSSETDPPLELVDFELVEWDSFDSRAIPAWLAMPRGPQPPDGYPAVVWVHGGPVSQARPNFRPEMQMLAAQGYAVLMPNVRGSSGYGRAWCESDDRDSRLDTVADLAAGARWLASHPAINGKRIGIMGQSYGGFMVLSAITEYPALWKAAVDYYGIADFTTLLAGTGPWRRSHRAAEYGDPERDSALFQRISPIGQVDRVTAPLLVLHGTRDPRVPFGESEQFVTALRERQKPVEFLVFDYAGHGFVRLDDRQRAYAAVAGFFRKHL